MKSYNESGFGFKVNAGSGGGSGQPQQSQPRRSPKSAAGADKRATPGAEPAPDSAQPNLEPHERAERGDLSLGGPAIVSEADSRRIRTQLDRVLYEAGAGSTLLLDRSGEVISARGDALPRDLNVLGALLAGAFATSREVARMMNDMSFRTLLQQGMRENTLTEMIGESWILVVMFDRSTHIGLVKELCRLVMPELEAILLQVQRRSRSVSGLNPSFRTSVEDTIDLLFKD